MLESEHFWHCHLPSRVCEKILSNSTLGEDYIIALEVGGNLVCTISVHNYVNKSELCDVARHTGKSEEDPVRCTVLMTTV